MPKDQDQNQDQKPPDPIKLISLDQIESVCRNPADTPIRVKDKVYLFPLRLLTPAENERLNRIITEVTAPIVEQEDPKTGQMVRVHDMANPDYITKVNRLLKIARATALSWCCPLFESALKESAGKPFEFLNPVTGEAEKIPALDPRNRDHLAAFVGSKLTEELLEQLYRSARSEEDQEDERVDF